jgi:competence protein ComEA
VTPTASNGLRPTPAAATFAAVDVNKATAAELDGIKGIGPAISTKIIDERKKGNYKDWNDFITRVRRGRTNAAVLFRRLTVNGAAALRPRLRRMRSPPQPRPTRRRPMLPAAVAEGRSRPAEA